MLSETGNGLYDDAMDALPDIIVDPVECRLGYQLRRASAVMMADLGMALAEIGLRPAEATLLSLIGVNPGRSQSDFGRQLGIKRANMVPLTAAMLKAGLIEREATDGRSHALGLTSKGEALRARAEAIIEAHEARFRAGFDDKRLAALVADLIAIRETSPDGRHVAPRAGRE